MAKILDPLTWLQEHLGHGKANAVRREELCLLSGLSDRDMRKMIMRAKFDGLCVSNAQDGKGYFIPVTEEEVRAQLAQEERRAKKILVPQKNLKNLLHQIQDAKDYGRSFCDGVDEF